jgi:WD40 repeat protein
LATLPASTNLPAYNNSVWIADGKYLAVKRDYRVGYDHGDWEVWDAAAGRLILLLKNRLAVSFHPHPPRVMAVNADGVATLMELMTGTEISRIQLTDAVFRIRFSPDGERIMALSAADKHCYVSVHNATNGVLLASQDFAGTIATAEWHPSGRWLGITDYGGAVRTMDAQSGEVHLLGRHKAEAMGVAFDREGDYLFTGGWDQEFICWDTRKMVRAFTISLNSHVMQMSADGRRCAVLRPADVQLHTIEQAEDFREFSEDLGGRLVRAAFSADGRWLAATGAKQLGLWDLTGNGAGILVKEGYEGYPYFTPDGKELLASRSHLVDSAGVRWRIVAPTNSGSPPALEALPFHNPPGFAFFDLHSNSVAMTTTNGSQLLTSEQIEIGPRTWLPTIAGVNRVSPDGNCLAIYAPFSATVYLHQLPQMERLAVLTHPAPVADFRFSPGGDELALASRSGVEFWETVTWTRKRWLTNFNNIIRYTADGRGLWLMTDLRNSGLYDAHTLEPLLLLPPGLLPLATTADGQRLAVSVDTRQLQVWDLAAVRTRLREMGMDWE